MNKLILAAAASLLAANLALAQTVAAPAAMKAPSEKQVQQQARMKSCNQDAGEKKIKGAERKKFMSGCLKADKPAEAKPADAAKPALAAPAKPAGNK